MPSAYSGLSHKRFAASCYGFAVASCGTSRKGARDLALGLWLSEIMHGDRLCHPAPEQ